MGFTGFYCFFFQVILHCTGFRSVVSCFVARAYWIGWIVLVQHVVCLFVFFFLKTSFNGRLRGFTGRFQFMDDGQVKTRRRIRQTLNMAARHSRCTCCVSLAQHPIESHRLATLQIAAVIPPPSPTNLLHFFLAWIVLDSFRMGCEGWSSLQAIWFMEPIEIVMCSRRWLLSLSDFAVFISC